MKKPKTYSGRDGSWSGRTTPYSKGVNKAGSAAIGSAQKVRSGAQSQKVYMVPEKMKTKPGAQIFSATRNPGSSNLKYPIKKTKPKK